MSMEDKKRSYSARPGSSRDPSPPPKRQFLGAQQSSTPVNGVNGHGLTNPIKKYLNAEGNIDIGDPETLEAYQKEAIYRQMCEYKRELARVLKINENLEAKQDDYDEHLSIVNMYWEQLINDLQMLISRADQDGTFDQLISQSGRVYESNFLKRLTHAEEQDLKPALKQKCAYSRELVGSLLQMILAWFEQRNELVKTLQIERDLELRESKVVQKLKIENEELNRIFAQNQKRVDEFQSHCSSLSFEVQSLKDKLQKEQNRHKETRNLLEETKSQLLQKEKQIDRVKCPTLHFWTYSKKKAELAPVEPPPIDIDQPAEKSQERFKKSSPVTDQFPLLPDIIKARDQEIERQEQEIVQLKQEFEQLTIKYETIPDDRVVETAMYKNLQIQFYHTKETIDQYRLIIENQNRELEELRGNRRLFEEQAEKEAHQKVAEITKELHMLEADLNRVRSLRDAAVQDAELAKAGNSPVYQQIPALRRLSNARKSQIRRLMDEIRLINSKIAYEAGDMASVEWYSKERELNEDASLYDLKLNSSLVADLRGKLKNAELEISELRRQLEAYRDASPDVKKMQSLIVSERKLHKEIDTLKRRLDEYDAKYGIRDPGDDPLHILSAKISEKEKRIKELENEVTYYRHRESTQVRDLTELDKSMADLDEKANQKMFDMIKHENEMMRLNEMKAKAEQKCQALTNKSHFLENQNKDYAVLRQKMEETIRQQDYMIKTLNQQLSNFEKETASATSVIQAHKLKLQETINDNAAIREKLLKSESRFEQFTQRINEKIKECEHESTWRHIAEKEKSQIMEEYEKLLKQKQTQSSSSSFTYNPERVYQELVKCSVCKAKTVDTCILRCMHLFCGDCIDKRLEFRSRKCPKCGETFGANDKRKIYF